MFEIGFWELVLIGVVALVVIGPERLPAVARTLGRWIARARNTVGAVRAEVERELRLEEMKRSILSEEAGEQFRQLQDQIRSLETELRSGVQSAATEAQAAICSGEHTDARSAREAAAAQVSLAALEAQTEAAAPAAGGADREPGAVAEPHAAPPPSNPPAQG